MGLDKLTNGILTPKNLAIGAGSAAVLGGGIALIAANRSRKSKKKSQKRRSKKGRYTPYTAGKRKDRSRKRIRYTKNGQPYVIMANGRARFISKKSVSSSRKRRGGRY